MDNTEYEAYMCKTDFEIERGQPMYGDRFYASLEDLKRHQNCTYHCGIVKIKVSLVEVIQDAKRHE